MTHEQMVVAIVAFALAAVVALVGILRQRPVPLSPGLCECGHKRCNHAAGDGTCRVAVGPEYQRECACQRYIAQRNAADAEVDALERMYRA